MDPLASVLTDPARAGVYHLNREPRDAAAIAEAAGLACVRIDIGHAHDKAGFIGYLSKAMNFPSTFGNNWDALADTLKDLSWYPGGASGKGWVVVLEKSKHFCAAHHHEFEEAMDLMAEVSASWKGDGKAFWTLVGGPEGWHSGFPDLPAA